MILDKIAASTVKRVAVAKENISTARIKEAALAMNCSTAFPFEKQLARQGVNFICEVKKASPSKGVIAQDFPYLEIAREYEAAGAAAISVLTEPKYFLGESRHLKEISEAVNIPCLRKDFTVDEYMIYEAKLLGAAAVLLICTLLDERTVKNYLHICDTLGLSALVEVHNEEEMRAAIAAGARIIGVNNRNLKDFSIDIGNSRRLRKLAPAHTLFVSESGIKTAADIANLRDVNAVLVGEALMRAPDKKKFLDEMRGNAI